MGSNNGGYTSGAFNTDDEPGSLSFCLEKEVTQPQGRTEDLAGQCAGTSCTDLLQETAPSPGSGYSLGDYAPLSTLITKPGKTPATKSPPKKRRRYEGRPGKTMKEAYFKGIHWTKTFVTGPLDPLHNQYKFYCRICRTIRVDSFKRGAGDSATLSDGDTPKKRPTVAVHTSQPQRPRHWVGHSSGPREKWSFADPT